METKDLIGAIKSAGKAKRTLEFKYPKIDGFYVQITYATKFILNQIREFAREISTDFRTRGSVENYNDEKLRQGYAKNFIKGWKGLTSQTLQKMLPGLVVKGKELGAEIPFTQDLAFALLTESIEFENWIINTAMTVENYQPVAEKQEEEEGNLKN